MYQDEIGYDFDSNKFLKNLKKDNFKKKFFLRKIKISFFKWLKQKISNKFLESISSDHLSLRRFPTAIFANDYLSNNLCIDGFDEKELLDNILKFMQILKVNFKKITFIDMGANIGNHSIYFSSIVKNVHAFEVNPLVFNLLKFNAELRKNIIPHNVGLGEKYCTSKLFVYKPNLGASFIKPKMPYQLNKKDFLGPINVEIKPFDEYLNKCGNIGIIKLDVEGMEYMVLKGAKKTISKYKPIILFEQQLDAFKNKSSVETKATSLLKEYSYKFYVFRYPQFKKGFLICKLNLIKDILFNSRSWDAYVEEVNHLDYGFYKLVVALPLNYQKIYEKLNL